MTRTTQQSLYDKWQQLADQSRADAEKLPEGEQRDGLLKQARQLDTAAQMGGWLKSDGLQAPK